MPPRPRPDRVLAAGAALVLLTSTASNASTHDPLVHVIIHLEQHEQQPQSGPPDRDAVWFCSSNHRPFHTVATPQRLLRAYDAALRAQGTVQHHLGPGTWSNDAAPDAPLQFESGDHVDLLTRVSRARRFLPAFMQRVRADLDQREVLAEVLDASYGTASQRRTRFVVTLPATRAHEERLMQVHRIFADRGRGGDTQIDVPGGVQISSAVVPGDERRIEAGLRNAHVPFHRSVETFLTVDAPPCSRAG